MILARPLNREPIADLELALSRMGLPSAAREYLHEKLPHLTLLLTGIGREEGVFLKGLGEHGQPPGVELFPTFISGNVLRRPGTALLTGRQDQFARLCVSLGSHPELAGLLRAVSQAVSEPRRPPSLGFKSRELVFGARTYLMGVLNVTPDSFSDGGTFFEASAAVAHGLAMVAAGADILDLGGESTRPGAPEISADEELARVMPVLLALREQTDVPLSVDTTKAVVAKEALRSGAELINDISGLSLDPLMAKTVAEAGAACCVMHIQGTPRTMQERPNYEDVISEVAEGLAGGLARGLRGGIRADRMLVDPGIGFGKTPEHNLYLLRRLAELRVLGHPVLVGTSRKAFLGALGDARPASQRLLGTLGSIAYVATHGSADVVRVHDVREAKETLSVVDAIRHSRGGGNLA